MKRILSTVATAALVAGAFGIAGAHAAGDRFIFRGSLSRAHLIASATAPSSPSGGEEATDGSGSDTGDTGDEDTSGGDDTGDKGGEAQPGLAHFDQAFQSYFAMAPAEAEDMGVLTASSLANFLDNLVWGYADPTLIKADFAGRFGVSLGSKDSGKIAPTTLEEFFAAYPIWMP